MRRDVFQAIADPVRRDILDLLVTEPLTVSEVATRFEISRPAVSKHLKILEECELISVKQVGRERFCQLKPMTLLPAFFWINQYQQLWEDRVDSFEAYLKKLQTKDTSDGQIRPKSSHD